MIAAYFGGLWPGLLATLLSAAAVNYFIIEPRYSFVIANTANAVALADVSQFAVIKDTDVNRKLLIISKALVPDISLIDPATLTTMDAFCRGRAERPLCCHQSPAALSARP